MSVLIKGMKMPKGCDDCEKLFWSNFRQVYACWLTKTAIAVTDVTKERNKDCPLVEIPTPHGRLIDVDDVKSKMIPLFDFSAQKWISEVDLSSCKSIVEAEG